LHHSFWSSSSTLPEPTGSWSVTGPHQAQNHPKDPGHTGGQGADWPIFHSPAHEGPEVKGSLWVNRLCRLLPKRLISPLLGAHLNLTKSLEDQS
jgi:hypothetical protein